MLNLVTVPNKLLRQSARLITWPLSPDIAQLVEPMMEAMLHYDGIGLAAPQVGQSIRLITIHTETGPRAYFNPRVIKTSWRKELAEEGCLSVPEVFGLVKRSIKITAVYQDLAGNEIREDMSGLLARVFQHETDHINGILFTDKTKKITKGQNLLQSYGKF